MHVTLVYELVVLVTLNSLNYVFIALIDKTNCI